jgi:CheY-like chemotaxis protein
MRFLIIDKDDFTSHSLKNKIEEYGFSYYFEPNRQTALERLKTNAYEAVIIDPAIHQNLRPLILDIRRQSIIPPVILICSADLNLDQALKAGVNDFIPKPYDMALLDQVIQNTARISALQMRFDDRKTDYPSANGIIAKSAFNQIFKSSLDRSDRYAEETGLLFIRVENYKEIAFQDSAAAVYASAQLAHNIAHLRRQSDIVGQTDDHEYCIMLQRPAYPSEPMDAASRFAEGAEKMDNLMSSGLVFPRISIDLITVPSGQLLFHHETL